MNRDDRHVDKLRSEWRRELAAENPPPTPTVTLTLVKYSELCRLLGRAEGMLLGTGLTLSAGGSDWGAKLLVEVDRLTRVVTGALDN